MLEHEVHLKALPSDSLAETGDMSEGFGGPLPTPHALAALPVGGSPAKL